MSGHHGDTTGHKLRCPVCKSTNVECHGRHGHECLDCRYDGRQAVVTCSGCGGQMWAAMDFEERVCGACMASPGRSEGETRC